VFRWADGEAYLPAQDGVVGIVSGDRQTDGSAFLKQLKKLFMPR